MNSDDCQRKSGDTFTSSTTTHALQSPTTFRRLKEQKARFLDEDHVPVVAAQRDGSESRELFIALIPHKKEQKSLFILVIY